MAGEYTESGLRGVLLAPRTLLERFILPYLRRTWVVLRILPPFLKACVGRKGIISHEGRLLIWGKMRRSFLSQFPGYSRKLQQRYGIQGGCTSCGASCNLLFRCPHWDESSHLCTVYEDRPDICRLFPITPTDIRDRSLVLKDKPCGFTFTNATS